MTILVTGATGFIGRRLVEQLGLRGETLHLLCRPSSDTSGLTSARVRILAGDITDRASIERASMGCDRIFHIAAYARNWARDPAVYHQSNVAGLRNVLEAAIHNRVKRVVFTSSSVTFGPSNGDETTEVTRRASGFLTDYEHSKFLAEQEIERYLQGGLEVVVVNPTRVFGPGPMNEGNAVTRMIQLYLSGRFRVMLDDGGAIGNYAYVDDVVRGHLEAMECGIPGARYILGGENVSYVEFFRVLAELSGRRRLMVHLPPSLALAYSRLEDFRARRFDHFPVVTPGWVRTFLADWAFSSNKAVREIGYVITPLRAALEATVRWLEGCAAAGRIAA